MIQMQLSEAAQHLGVNFTGPDSWFDNVSTDSRTIKPGELYCAIRGTNFDGHDYCSSAQKSGAVGAIVERIGTSNLSQIEVPDTRAALGMLAKAWRRKFQLPVVGVTGSNGKTTVKEMIASILSGNGSVLSTEGNLNNEIGVPQTLFRLGEEHDYAVIEMGASALGEIRWLAHIAQPEVGVITLCAPAHIEGFGSVERVAQAKAELYAGLSSGGTAIINADDKYAGYWGGIASGHKVLHFGQHNKADVAARNTAILGIGKGVRFTLHLPTTTVDIELPFDGEHNVANALAAAAVAFSLDISPDLIKRGLECAGKVNGRLCVHTGPSGSRIIDDTYNANPASLAVGVKLLAKEKGRTCVILGDMGELGRDAIKAHRDAGRDIRSAGIESLYTLGDLAAEAATGFGDGARSFHNVDELRASLAADLVHPLTVLVKGSRFMRMERVVHALVPESR